MGSHGIVQPSPLLDEDDSLGQCVEDLSVQELVSELTVEALVVAVLPRTARLDEQCLYAYPGQPPPYELGRELRPVVRAQMHERTVASEQIGQDLEYVVDLLWLVCRWQIYLTFGTNRAFEQFRAWTGPLALGASCTGQARNPSAFRS